MQAQLVSSNRIDWLKMEGKQITAPHPDGEIWLGRELMTMGANRKGVRCHGIFTRNAAFWPLALLNEQIENVADVRLRKALLFCLTAIILSVTAQQAQTFWSGRSLTGLLYVASLIREENVAIIWDRRAEKLTNIGWSWQKLGGLCCRGQCDLLHSLPPSLWITYSLIRLLAGNLYYADASIYGVLARVVYRRVCGISFQ